MIGSMIRCLFIGVVTALWASHALALNAADYEEAAGFSLLGFRDPSGEVYGGGFESGVWLRGTPVFSEIFGHWFANTLQDANYYGIGITVRMMARTAIAPFVGVGGSYNGLTSRRNEVPALLRPPDNSYWAGHGEAGLRLWLGPGRAYFVEGTYREHWTESGSAFDFGWIALEYGQRF